MLTNRATPTTLAARNPGRPPGLLVSVRGPEEAADALAGGADVVDVKEPSAGTLGQAPRETLAAVLAEVAGRVPVTAALGELKEAGGTSEADRLKLPPGLAAVKCGLSGSANTDWRTELTSLRDSLPRQTRLVPAAYADYSAAEAPSPEEVLDAAARLGSGWLVLDTWDKATGDSLQLLTPDRAGRLLAEATSLRISVVLAGRLSVARLEEAAALGPALIGVRGAACIGGRDGRVTTERVRALVARLSHTKWGPKAAR